MSDAAGERKPRVVALGETMLRLSTPGRLDRADGLDVHVAGSESNVAVALAQLGWNASWFSALPDTPPGRRVATSSAVAASTSRQCAGSRVRASGCSSSRSRSRRATPPSGMTGRAPQRLRSRPTISTPRSSTAPITPSSAGSPRDRARSARTRPPVRERGRVARHQGLRRRQLPGPALGRRRRGRTGDRSACCDRGRGRVQRARRRAAVVARRTSC